MMTIVLCVVVGTLLVLLAVFDIFTTVLHPEIESPLSNRFQQLVWRALRGVDRLINRRIPVLNWGLPLMVAGLIVLWLTLLIVGFGLLYFPWIGNEAVFASENPVEPTLANALYLSGVTVATLGYGDIQPIPLVFRLLAVIQALLGFVAVSFSVTYVLAIYPSLSHRRTVATALDAEIAGQANGLPMAQRYLAGEYIWQQELAERLRELGMELLAMTESHEQHTVLYYAHERRVQHSFLRMLIVARNLVGLLRYSLSPQHHPEIVFHPHLLMLEQSLHHSLRRLNASLHLPMLPPPDDEHTLLEEYQQLCAALHTMGLRSALQAPDRSVPVLIGSDSEEPTLDNELHQRLEQQAIRSRSVGERASVVDPATEMKARQPHDSFVVFRLEVDPHIAAYAAVSGYDLEAASANYETRWWVGRG